MPSTPTVLIGNHVIGSRLSDTPRRRRHRKPPRQNSRKPAGQIVSSAGWPVFGEGIKAGDIVYAAVSVQQILCQHGRRVYDSSYQPPGTLDYEHWKKSLLLGNAVPSEEEEGHPEIQSEMDSSLLQGQSSADMAGNKDYRKNSRPCLVLGKAYRKDDSYIVIAFTTFDGTGLSTVDRLARAVSYPLEGSAEPHVWEDIQNGERVSITNEAVNIPGLRRPVHGKYGAQYGLAVPFILKITSLKNNVTVKADSQQVEFFKKKLKLHLHPNHFKNLRLP